MPHGHSKVTGSWSAIVLGLSIGREGPLIAFGGTLGGLVARTWRLAVARARVLVAAGTAAGFAPASNTPFAAVLFVLETMVGIVALDALLAAMAATVIATVLAREAVGGGPFMVNVCSRSPRRWNLHPMRSWACLPP